jgi:hypothetical membrane protein
MNNRRIKVCSGAVALFVACAVDFLSMFILGSKCPGYSQISDPISYLGASTSPVSGLFSFIWIILGLLIMVFALGLRAACSPADRYVKIVFWLLILYGLGEGLGSGLFKTDFVNHSLSASFIIHDILGGIGIFALLTLMIIVPKIEGFSGSRSFLVFSKIVFFIGILLLLLFSQRFLRKWNSISAGIAEYTGFWQRLLLLDFYIYLIVIAVRTLKRRSDLTVPA